MEKKDYLVGTQSEVWKAGGAQQITFIVTADCNLRCKYCYITHKSGGNRMDFETAKKFIDYILDDNSIRKQEAVVLDFIGGEPLLKFVIILSWKLLGEEAHGIGIIGLTFALMGLTTPLLMCKNLLKRMMGKYMYRSLWMTQKKSTICKEFFPMERDLMT